MVDPKGVPRSTKPDKSVVCSVFNFFTSRCLAVTDSGSVGECGRLSQRGESKPEHRSGAPKT